LHSITLLAYNIPKSLSGTKFSVKDEGIGISKSEQTNIFKRYQRFNKDRGGFGIGLNIVLKIANANGIKISINSKEGRGAEFIFDIAQIINK